MLTTGRRRICLPDGRVGDEGGRTEGMGRRRVKGTGSGSMEAPRGGGVEDAGRRREGAVVSECTGEEVVGRAGCPTPMGVDGGGENWGEFIE